MERKANSMEHEIAKILVVSAMNINRKTALWIRDYLQTRAKFKQPGTGYTSDILYATTMTDQTNEIWDYIYDPLEREYKKAAKEEIFTGISVLEKLAAKKRCAYIRIVDFEMLYK